MRCGLQNRIARDLKTESKDVGSVVVGQANCMFGFLERSSFYTPLNRI